MDRPVTRTTFIYKWYAVYTKSRAEKKACNDLEQRGIECYLPIKHVKRQWGKQKRTVEFPLIPGYLFVRVSNREYFDVLMNSGILRYVCFEGRPAVIPDFQIEALKLFIDKQNEDVEVTSEGIHKGDLIRVVSGPLESVCAEVAEIRGKHRIVLRFKSLGCCIHVDLGQNRIEVIERSPVVPSVSANS